MKGALVSLAAAVATAAIVTGSGSGSLRSTSHAAADLTPFQISAHGTKPDVAVDAEGTAHIVSNEIVDGGADVLHYCRVPRDALMRRAKTFIPPSGDDGNARNNKDVAGPRVLITGSDQVTVITERETGVHTTDQNGNFDPQCRRDYTTPGFCYSSGFTDGLRFARRRGHLRAAPDSRARVHRERRRRRAVRGRLPVHRHRRRFAEPGFGAAYGQMYPGGYARTPAALTGSDTAITELTTAPLHDDTPVVVYTDATSGGSSIRLKRYGGTGSPNDPRAWQTPFFVGIGREPKASAAGGDVYLLYRPGSTDQAQYALRRFDGKTLQSLGPVSDGGTVAQDALFVDDSGRVHAAWVTHVVAGSAHDELRYRNAPDGTSFGDTTELVRGATNAIWNVHLGAADDGGGFAVSRPRRTPTATSASFRTARRRSGR